MNPNLAPPPIPPDSTILFQRRLASYMWAGYRHHQIMIRKSNMAKSAGVISALPTSIVAACANWILQKADRNLQLAQNSGSGSDVVGGGSRSVRHGAKQQGLPAHILQDL